MAPTSNAAAPSSGGNYGAAGDGGGGGVGGGGLKPSPSKKTATARRPKKKKPQPMPTMSSPSGADAATSQSGLASAAAANGGGAAEEGGGGAGGAPGPHRQHHHHHHGHHHSEKKPVRMRTNSEDFRVGKDFPLGAFAAKDELPTKSNRQSIRSKATHHQKPPTGKSTAAASRKFGGGVAGAGAATATASAGDDEGGDRKKPSMADLADIAVAEELAELAELGRVETAAADAAAALLSTAGGGRSPPGEGRHRGRKKGRNARHPLGGGSGTGGGRAMGPIADGSEVSHDLDRGDGGSLLPDQDALARGPIPANAPMDGQDSLRYSVDGGGLGGLTTLLGAGFLDSLSPVDEHKSKLGRSALLGESAAAPGSQPPPPPYQTATEQTQQQMDIATFASLALGGLDDGDALGSPAPPASGGNAAGAAFPPSPSLIPAQARPNKVFDAAPAEEDRWEDDEDYDVDEGSRYDEEERLPETMYERVMWWLDPTPFLMSDVKLDEKGVPYFDDWMGWGLAGFVRTFFYNPLSPEFTALQQFIWACVIGVIMGVYTAAWKIFIEKCVDFFWEKVPEFLLERGVFTEPEGRFPLYHYMWICPAIFGGILSYVFVILPNKIPDQNEWINNVHNRGVLDFRTFFNLFFLATMGMASGMSLGPELPLVLTAGMAGSWLGIVCKQSVLQARVMNLTAASAAVGGFFGFPMAGALFVLEIPHRMGLQYFEALSPATIASIVAVLCNRIIMANDVTGYYKYPFLTATLPSEIFTSAIIFGLYGALVGTIYANACKKLKGMVHDWFHAPHDHSDHENSNDIYKAEQEAANEADGVGGENKPLLGLSKPPIHAMKKHPPMGRIQRWRKCLCCVIPTEKYRAAVAGTIAGALVGVICIFVPHVMFWGEAQLQTLIDRGRTPLPVFGIGEEPTAGLTALGFCMTDHSVAGGHKETFSVGCSFLVSAAKILVTGLSLGTGIIGGHFWGPLFVGCSASHFLVDCVRWFSSKFGFGGQLAAYPCVAILCTMGSTHVVTFRAHTAIMLILTLTISTFDAEGGDDNSASVAGDYSAIFPLLVVSVFVSLMVSRQTVFYPTQRSRGDIMAVPEVLCEPGMEGRPMVIIHEGSENDEYSSSDESYDSDGGLDGVATSAEAANSMAGARAINLTQSDIEKEFMERSAMTGIGSPVYPTPAPGPAPAASVSGSGSFMTSGTSSVASFEPRSASPMTSDIEKDYREKAAIAGMPPPRVFGPSTVLGAPGRSTSASPPVLTPFPAAPSSSNSADAFMNDLPSQSFDLGDDTGTRKQNKNQSSDLMLSSARLDELLSHPIDDDDHMPLPKTRAPPPKRRHRRIQSAPVRGDLQPTVSSSSEREMDRRFGKEPPPAAVPVVDPQALHGVAAAVATREERYRPPSHQRTNSGSMARIATYGEVKFHQPSLLDQARSRAASAAEDYVHRRVNSVSERPGHSRTNSNSSLFGGFARQASGSTGHSRQGSESSLGGYGSATAPTTPNHAPSAAAPSRERHRRKNSEPLAVNSSAPIGSMFGADKPGGGGGGRHFRKSSDPFGGAMPKRTPPRRPTPPSTPRGGGALPMEDIEHAFDSLLKSGGAGL